MVNSESILIVEDDAIIALTEQQTLQNYGYKVYIASDGDSAVKIACCDKHIDLILMDIDLGEDKRDGTEIAKEILSLCKIPIIFLSSHSEPEVVERTEQITSYGYIVKGCNDAILHASIKMAFKLHRSNEYLRTLLEASPDGIWVSDRFGRILDVNDTYCKVSGYTKDELIGKNISELDTESDFDQVVLRIRELGPGQIEKLPTIHLKKNGEPLYVEASIARINLDTEPEIVTFCRDCTEERRLTDNIAAVEQEFENIIGSIQDAVFTLDAEMKVTGIFGPWIEQHSINAEDLQGRGFTESMRAMGAEFDESYFYKALKDGYSLFETTIKSPAAAEVVHFQISFSQMRNKHGEVSGVVGIGRNITELVDAREDLKKRERLYSSLLSHVPGAIYQYQYFMDDRSCFPFSSQNIELVYEVTPEEVKFDAAPVFKRLHPDDHKGVVESILKSRDSLTVWEYDYRVILPKRGIRWLRGLATPERQPDDSVLWSGFITDITDLKEIEERLVNQKELLYMTLKSIGDAVLTTDKDGNITDINEAAEELTGWTAPEATGRIVSEVFDVSKKVGGKVSDFQAAEPGSRYEGSGSSTVLKSKDGREYRILDSTAPIRGRNGKTEGAVIVFRDITEKYRKGKQLESTVLQLKKALVQLSDQSRSLQGVIDATMVGTWEWNVQTGEVRFNERWAEMLGYTLAELSPVSIETWKELVHPEDLSISDATLERHFSNRSGFYECEVRMRHRDGQWIWILDRGSVSTWTIDGRPEWVFGTHKDITEQKILEAETRQSEKQLRALFENIEMGFALHEVIRDDSRKIIDYRFIEANETYGYLTGLETREILLCRASELDSGLQHNTEEWISRYAHVVDTGKSIQFESFSTVSNRWYSVTAYRPQEDMVATLFFDTTENKKILKERERALYNQKILMEELNHRVKNNLLMVKSLIHLKDVEAGELIDLSDIESRVQAIAELHEELQDTAKLDKVPLHSYISRIAENVIDNNPLPVRLKLDLTAQEVSTKFAVSIGLIINEAVTNAIKHGFKDHPSPLLEIKSSLDDDEGTIVISNNGSPLPETLDLKKTHSLGLRLVTTLVRQINGSIELQRTPHPEIIIRYKN